MLSLVSSAYGSGTRQPLHTHDELQISIVLRGTIEESVGRSVERASALSVVVKDPGVRHADRFGDSGALTAQLKVRDTTLADFIEHPNRALAWRWTHDSTIATPFLRVVARGLAGQRTFAADDDDIVDLIAAVSARVVVPVRAGRPRWLEEMVARVRDDWRAGFSVRGVAREAGVHPVYFARCVRRWYGLAAADLLRQARLRHAARHIADGDSTIAAVAHATGFSDEPHLSREFSRSAGLAPGRYRRLARAVHQHGIGR